ncbi:MerR family DNA-binding transcriptional regulator [Streptomyces mirabilis]|uniref:MerR family DNA-binding transcriptional regulator n=1 Tax=Streptomyces mirabilis TaxID=68239 RepID=UPI0033254345
MRIGEPAARTGATPRQVRFYEAKGLITSTREPNNYRDYSETTLGRPADPRVAGSRPVDGSDPRHPALHGIPPATRSSSTASSPKR